MERNERGMLPPEDQIKNELGEQKEVVSMEGLVKKIADGSATLEDMEKGNFSYEEERELKKYIRWLAEETEYQHRGRGGIFGGPIEKFLDSNNSEFSKGGFRMIIEDSNVRLVDEHGKTISEVRDYDVLPIGGDSSDRLPNGTYDFGTSGSLFPNKKYIKERVKEQLEKQNWMKFDKVNMEQIIEEEVDNLFQDRE